MSTVIQTKHSLTTTNEPATLADGELAVNPVDGKLWAGNGGVNALIASPVVEGNALTLEGENKAYYLNSTNQNAGTLNAARLTGTYAISVSGNAATATLATNATTAANSTLFDGNNAAYYQNSTNQTAGTLPSARLSGSYNITAATATNADDSALLDGSNSAFYRNAGNLNAGTLPTARISGSYAGITTVGTLSLLQVTGSATFSDLSGVGDRSIGVNAAGRLIELAGSGGIALTDLSVAVAAAGTPNLSYNNANGVFTYTPPDLTSYATATSATAFSNKTGNISQWTNDSGYLTAFTETDTLDTVTTRGATTANAVTVGSLTSTGEITANGGLALGDNDKATFGVSDDLEIYHSGTNSHITDTGTGNLIIGGANVEITTAGGTKYLQGAANVLKLYHTGSEKLRTSAAGIDVTGDVTATGNLTSKGIDDNATTTALTISSASVITGLFTGVGVSQPSSKFEVVSALPGSPDANTIYFVT